MRASSSAWVSGDFAFRLRGRFSVPASKAAITASFTYEVRHTVGVLDNSSYVHDAVIAAFEAGALKRPRSRKAKSPETEAELRRAS